MFATALDKERLRKQYLSADPFPFCTIDELLDPIFARGVAQSYPSFDDALVRGKTFATVNERKKVQITDTTRFPRPVAELNAVLASPSFLADLSYITGIDQVLADDQLVGGGMHITGPGGRLDVHVDFNLIAERGLHRRLNLLLYLNPTWQDEWGGHLQLWDREVKRCVHTFAPVFNRCVIFETSNISFHGVVPIHPSAPSPRISFATYYYTKEAPRHFDGRFHDTIFKARPEEPLRRFLMMPAERAYAATRRGGKMLKQKIKSLVAN